MAKPPNLRLAAILALVASALALIAFLITYSDGEGVKWPSLAASVFMAALGWTYWRKSKSGAG